MQTCS